MDKIYSSIKRSLNPKKQNTALLSLGVLLFFISIWLLSIYFNYYQDRFYPKSYIDDINISGLTKTEAKQKLLSSIQQQISIDNDNLLLFYEDKIVEAKLKDLDISNNLEQTIEEAFNANHQNFKLQKSNRYYVKLNYNEDKIKTLIVDLKNKIDSAGQLPSIELKNKEIQINLGQTSNELSVDETWQAISEQFLNRNLRDISKENLKVEAIVSHPILALDKLQAETAKNRAQKIVGQKLVLNYEYQKVEILDKELVSFLNLREGFNQEKIQEFIDGLKAQINRPSSNAIFDYDQETLEVRDFAADQDGLEINDQETIKIITNFLTELENNQQANNAFPLPMQKSKAEFTLEKSNDLGIKEVIGFGESWYAHSIPNRIDNVALTTSRITNHIVRPGEEFSFNKTLGEVSDKTGYKNAYIIEAGETKLAPGGGVCQVSSTLFRALLNAGLKVTLRLPHAYRVSYYEINNEPGFDATVYAGDTDLRFINDTDQHLLINCQNDSKNLYMFCKLYGTSDGRSTEIIKYKKWGQSPPLPTVYVPDASLAPGQLKQIDWAASGIKTEFTNVIKDKNGEIVREDYYKSNYKSWAARYLQGI